MLSGCASSIRKSNNQSKIFEQKQSRLRCESDTRWSSSFLMLRSFQKAYYAGCFDGESNSCPVSLETIKFLLHAYQFSIYMQRSDSSICDVLPGLFYCFRTWEFFGRVNVGAEVLCDSLVENFKEKFDFELDSNYYLVSALLHTSTHDHWFKENTFKVYVERAKEAIEPLVEDILARRADSLASEEPSQPTNAQPNPPKNRFKKFFNFLPTESSQASQQQLMRPNLMNEKTSLISRSNGTNYTNTETTQFWSVNRSTMPQLSGLWKYLDCIPGSSAFIERFFSI
jgi:hypothetical protein